MYATAHVEDKEQLVWIVFLFPLWVLGTELRLLVLCGQHSYPLGYGANPKQLTSVSGS